MASSPETVAATPLLANTAASLRHAARIGDALDGAAHEWFSHIMYVPLKPHGGASLVPETAMHSALQALGAEMAQQTAAPFDYGAELEHYKRSGGTRIQDAAPWRAELHGHNATAGVVRHIESGALPDYGVVVRTSAGPVGKKFAQFVRANPDMTVMQLQDTPEYKVARHYSERNAARIAANIAGAMLADPSYPVSNASPVRFDHSAVRESEYRSAPLLAVPAAHTRYNDIIGNAVPGRGQAADSRDSAYIGSLASAGPMTNQLLYHRDHIKGFALEPAGATPSAATTPVWDVARHMAVDENSAYREALHRDARAWRAKLSQTYKHVDGTPVAPTTAMLWQSSERPGRAQAAGAINLAPVAMFINAPKE